MCCCGCQQPWGCFSTHLAELQLMWKKEIKSSLFSTYLVCHMANGKPSTGGNSQMERGTSILSIFFEGFSCLNSIGLQHSLSLSVLNVWKLLTFPCLSCLYGQNFCVFSDVQFQILLQATDKNMWNGTNLCVYLNMQVVHIHPEQLLAGSAVVFASLQDRLAQGAAASETREDSSRQQRQRQGHGQDTR